MAIGMSFLESVDRGLIASGNLHHFLLATMENAFLRRKHFLTALDAGFAAKLPESIEFFAFVRD
jgi:hypothetical protein